jgi:serine/threonine protein phosphatase PrpC
MSPAATALTKQPWRVRGVSVTGYRHLQDGIDCQDAWRQETLKSHGTVILAVADGAGSRERAAEGSRLAVGLAISVFGQLFAQGPPAAEAAWKPLMRQGFTTIHRQFAKTTASLGGGSRPEDFATTLTVAVLSGDCLGIVRIGDGFVVVSAAGEGHDHESLHLVSHSESGSEYANQTDFLTSAGAEDAVQVDCLCDPELTSVLLSTDGLAPIALHGRKDGELRANAAFLERILPHLVAPHGDPSAVARLLQENERITSASGDDKTLLVAVRP